MSNFLGLSLSATDISLVEIIPAARKWQLKTFSHAPHPVVKSEGEYFAHLSRLLARASATNAHLNIALPGHNLFTATFKTPYPPTDDSIQRQAAAVIPVPLSQVDLSWRRAPHGQNIYLTATPKHLSAWLARLAKHLNLEIGLIEPEVFSLLRLQAPPGHALLLNVDRKNASAHIIDSHWPISSFSFTSPLALLNLLPRLQQEFKLSAAYLTGTMARDAALRSAVAAAGLEAIIYDPRYDLVYPPNWEKDLAALGSALGIALGLALGSYKQKLKTHHAIAR